MLTDEDKMVLLRTDYGFSIKEPHCPLRRIVRFDLNDAGLTRDWLVERGEWPQFLLVASHKCFDETALRNPTDVTSWLFATENGEAVNFFRTFAEWAKEKG